MMRRPLRAAAAMLLSVSALVVPPPEAGNAGPRYGRVTAHSYYGNGSVTGAVRKTGNYYQVQLPSGFWEDCEGDCRETLRRQHLDFWRSIDEDAPNGGNRN